MSYINIKKWKKKYLTPPLKEADSYIFDVLEDLNVYMNEIYKKLTTIKLNKFEFKKIF